jgi:hypothetical protein
MLILLRIDLVAICALLVAAIGAAFALILSKK